MRLTIPVEGGELAADDSGGDGPPLVLVHAGWADRSSWADVASRLAGRYRIISLRRTRDTARRRRRRHRSPSSPTWWRCWITPGCSGPRWSGTAAAGAPRSAWRWPARSGSPSLVLLAPGVQDYPWPMDDPYNTEFMALATAGDRAGLAELGLRTWAAADPADAAARAQVEGAVDGHVRAGRLRAARPACL